MALETRHAIDFNDIEALTFECASCHTIVIWPIAFDLELPRECPSCHKGFCEENSDLRAGLLEFLKGFRHSRHALGRADSPVTTRLKLKRSVIGS
jgi:hypothetical protein